MSKKWLVERRTETLTAYVVEARSATDAIFKVKSGKANSADQRTADFFDAGEMEDSE